MGTLGPHCSAGVEVGLDIHAGIAHLRQLVTQGPRADAQTLGGFLAATTLGATGPALCVKRWRRAVATGFFGGVLRDLLPVTVIFDSGR